MTASPSSRPALVPPNDTASTPTSVVIARSGSSKAAAALASRAPSTCSRIPAACACSASAASSADAVDRPELARLGDRDDARLDRVLVAHAHDPRGHELGRELAVGRRDRQQLDARHRLGRAALVDVQVRCLGAHHALPRPQQRPQGDDVGPRPVEGQEAAGTVAEVLAHPALEARRPLVGTVGARVAVVGRRDGLEHLGQSGGVVVGVEVGAHGERATITPARFDKLLP